MRYLLLVFLLTSGVAHAGDPLAQLVHATVTASSTLPPIDGHGFSPEAGLDEDMGTYWCEGNPKGAVGEWLQIELERPIPLATIYPIAADGTYVPKEKQVHVLEVDLEVDGKLVYTGGSLHEMKGATGKTIKVTIKKIDGPADGVACFNRVRLFVPSSPNGTYSPYTGDKAVLDAFRTAAEGLGAALSSCDAKRLATVVTFPLERHEWVGSDFGGHGGRDQVTTVKDAAQLAKRCKAQPKRWGLRGLLDDKWARPVFHGGNDAEFGLAKLRYQDGRWTMTEIR